MVRMGLPGAWWSSWAAADDGARVGGSSDNMLAS